MQGPIEARIAALRNQVRRVLALHGASLVVIGVVVAIFAATLADRLANLVPEVRLVLLIGLIGLAIYLTVRRVIVPLVVRFADLDIALRIEERWPGLNDRLASTIQFLKVDRNPTTSGDASGQGSQALRVATVAGTLTEVAGIDFRQAIDPGPTRRALGWAALVLLVGAGVIVAEPSMSRIALSRLFNPYGGTAWPRMTHLAILEATPRKLARGMAFPLVVGIGKNERMPSSARVTYRFSDGETRTEPLRVADDRTFRGRIEAVGVPFTFQVEAGDDRTTETGVTVVPPPTLDQITVRLTPPEYTRLKPQTLAAGNTQIRAVEGTKVEVEGHTNKAIATAQLRRGDKLGVDPVTITANGRQVASSFLVKTSQTFAVELKDAEGFVSQESVRFDVRALPDEPPRVSLNNPSHDRDVPAQATIPIEIGVEDDYGIQLVRLVYKVAAGGSEQTQDGVIPLWAPTDPAAGTEPEPPSRQRDVTYRWDLGTFGDLPPGTVVTIYGEARDFDSIKGPNLGKSREVRLRIVAKEEVDRQLEEQQRAIRDEVDRILAIQKQAKAPVDDALRTFSKTEKLPTPLRDQVKNAEIIQRQVNNRISNKTDGLDQKLRQFAEDSKDFKADNADALRQMAELRDGVQKIQDRNLAPAEQALTRANKQLDRPGEPDGDKTKPTGDAQADKTKPTGGTGKANETKPSAEDSKASETKPTDAGGKADETKPIAGEAKANETKPTGADARNGETKPTGADGKSGQPEAKPALAEAEKNQKAIVDELEKMLNGLSQFDTVRTAVKEAKGLLEQQEAAIKQAAEAAQNQDMAGKEAGKLSPEQKADLGNMAAKQSEIAKGLQNLESKMDEMAQKLEATDPTAAAGLREAAAQSRKQATAAKMGQTADQLDKNQMGKAQSGQAQAKRDLKNLVDSIQDRRSRELSRLVAELKAAEADLKKLRDKQAANLKKTQAARSNPDPKQRADELKKLAKEQQQIQEDLKKQVQKLAKLNQQGGAKAGEQAAGAMAKAQAGMEGDQGEQAEEGEEDALKNLREAQEEVAEARKDAEDQLAMEQIAKMADALKSIGERQDKMVEETVTYEKTRVDAGGKLTLAQRNSIREAGRVESGIKDEVTELVDRLGEGAPVFGLTLKRAGEALDTAAGRLGAGKTDDPTVRAEKSAAARLKQLIESLKPDKPKGGGNGGGGGGGGGGGAKGGGDGIPASAQIKVLKSLQEELNERTDFFDEARRRQPELTPEQTAELDKLHEDQGSLADLVRDLTRPKKDDGDN